MKMKLTALLLALTITLTFAPYALAADTVTAKPSKQTFYLDEQPVDVAAYVIAGSNYVKLRDVYQLLDYDVTYSTRTTGEFVLRTYTDKSYTPDGSESKAKPTADATAYTSTIYGLFNQSVLTAVKDMRVIAAYKIGGSNYIKLRDYAEVLYSVATADYSKNTPGYTNNQLKPEPTLKTFDVRYDPKTNSVHIYKNTPYTGKDIVDNTPVATPTPAPTPSPSNEADSKYAYVVPIRKEYLTDAAKKIALEIVRYTNEERVKAGVAELTVDNILMAMGQIQCQDMYDNGYFSHSSPTWGMVSNLSLTKEQIANHVSGNNSILDNIVEAQFTSNSNGDLPLSLAEVDYSKTARHIVDSWMNSPGHKAQMLNGRWSYIGVGVVFQLDSKGRCYYVQYASQVFSEKKMDKNSVPSTLLGYQ